MTERRRRKRPLLISRRGKFAWEKVKTLEQNSQKQDVAHRMAVQAHALLMESKRQKLDLISIAKKLELEDIDLNVFAVGLIGYRFILLFDAPEMYWENLFNLWRQETKQRRI